MGEGCRVSLCETFPVHLCSALLYLYSPEDLLRCVEPSSCVTSAPTLISL